MSKPIIVPVIMSGGAGTRLWPLSSEQKPKQMHALFGSRTLLQETIARVPTDTGFTAPIVICAALQSDEVEQQLSAVGVQALTIIGEPMPRNTAPCAVVAAQAVIDQFGPDALVLLLAADHFISDPVTFRQKIHQGASLCCQGHILTFGPQPTRPETGYGYLLAGDEIKDGVFHLQKFVEKPDIKTAQEYLADGRYLWNSGMFLFPAQLMLDEMAKHRPQIAVAASRAYESSLVCDGKMLLDEECFSSCPSLSIDNAVMENTDLGMVIALDVGWSDVGSWEAIFDLSNKDQNANAVKGPVINLNTHNCLIRSDKIEIAAVDVQDLAIIATDDKVLVIPLAQTQKVRDVVAKLNKNKL